MSEQVKVDILIVGAGIVGLSISKWAKERFSHLDIAVIDKMSYLGEHASGRNSGVLHAGLYYPANSLKKKLCLRGNLLWREWASQMGIQISSCGKFILANKDTREQFDNLFNLAKANGANVELVTKKKVDELSQYSPADLAFFSPLTAVIDPSETIKQLGNFVETLGVMLLLQHECKSIEQNKDAYRCRVNDFVVEAKILINAAGAGSIDLRRELGLSSLHLSLVKGHYLKTFSSFYNQALLYRLPEQNLKGLGIHTCIDFDGTVKFGPDTQDIEQLSYTLDEEHIEKMKDQVISSFIIDRDKLHGDFAGVRTKILEDGKLYSDFWIKSPLTNYIELCGIESPGLTSAPAIAEYLGQHFLDKMF